MGGSRPDPDPMTGSRSDGSRSDPDPDPMTGSRSDGSRSDIGSKLFP
jgi:hypothetical protein